MSNFNTNYGVTISNGFSQPAREIARAAQNVNNRFNRLSSSAMASSRSFSALGANATATIRPNIALSGAMNNASRSASNAASAYNNMTNAQVSSRLSATQLNRTTLSLPPNINRAAQAVNRQSEAMQRATSRARALERAQRDVNQAWGTAKGAALGALPGAVFGAKAVQAAANFERTEVAIQSMVGSAEIGKELTQQIVDFTSKTTLQEEQVLRVTKKLKAYGVANNELLPTIKMLGNFSEALDTDLGGLALVYGQVRSKQRLFAQEINQFGERGVPLLETLSKGLGISVKEVLKLGEKGMLSFDLVKQSLKALTKEGKPFHKMLEKIAQTTSGAFSIFGDNVKKTTREFGFLLSEAFNVREVTQGITKALIKFKDGLKVFRTESPELSKFVTRFITLAAIIGPTIIAIGALVKVIGMIGTAVAASLGMSLLAFSGIMIAISAVAAGLWFLIDNWDAVTGIIESWRINSEVFDSIVNAASHSIGFVANLFSGKFDNKIGGTIEQVGINFTTTFDQIKKTVFEAIDAIVNKFKEITKPVTDVFKKARMDTTDAIESTVKGITGAVGSVKDFLGMDTGIKASKEIDSMTRSEAKVKVEISDPAGMVKSVESETVGPLNMTTGFNMSTL